MEIKALLDDMGIDEEFYGAQKRFVDDVMKRMKEYDYLKDLTMLFSGRDHMYFDSLHYSEQGNQLIAKAVRDIIIEEMGI